MRCCEIIRRRAGRGRRIARSTLWLVLAGLAAAGEAPTRLPEIFSEHMVLQRDVPLPVWGWDVPGAEVTVSFGDARVAGRAGPDGRWEVALPPQAASAKARDLVVRGSTEVRVGDALVGEVWLASGQSNMEWLLRNSEGGPEAIRTADAFPAIRLFNITGDKRTADFPSDTVGDVRWRVSSQESAALFSGVGYFFARELHAGLGVPIGIVASAWGGTRIEPWTPLEGFGLVNELQGLYRDQIDRQPDSPVYREKIAAYLDGLDAWIRNSRVALASGKSLPIQPRLDSAVRPPSMYPGIAHWQPRSLYNAMIAGLTPYAFRGAIWYQGENNMGDALYAYKQKALVLGWRERFRNPGLWFFYVQLAPYAGYSVANDALPLFWERQSAFQSMVPRTGMVVIHDTVDPPFTDIHPVRKLPVARRLARLALHDVYEQQNLAARGPVFASLAAEGDRLRVNFDHAEGGLASRDGQPLVGFEILGSDGLGWQPAEAVMDGASVLLSAAKTRAPSMVRFAWSNTATPNLVNGAGLPASSFRAGTAPLADSRVHIPEAAGYRLAYDLDLARLSVGDDDMPYDARPVDNPGTFSRVAYLLELSVAPGAPTAYLWASMDAFTDDPARLGVPTYASGTVFQREVTGLNVFSNVDGVPTGTGGSGWLEFWPNNYAPRNAKGVPGASDTAYDWGDAPTDPVDGYGSMQLHWPGRKAVLFALNGWKAGPRNADIGIGTNPRPGASPDYTFSRNAADWTEKRLRVWIR